MNEKETGSFYTPENLIQYMVKYALERIYPKKILEPSAGDGRFVKFLRDFNADVSLVESDPEKASKLTNDYGNECNVHALDFLQYAYESNDKYDLIIGNPPYITKKNVPDEQSKESEEILEYFHLDKSIYQNLWVSFVLASIKLLSDDGVIFFVLPFEFLQVQYAEKLRKFLESKFNTIEIITFEERVFEGIEQDICLVYLANAYEAKPYIQYSTYKDADAMNKIFESVIMRNKPLKKWSNCILNDEETEKLLQLSNRYSKIAEFGDISPGIVTGANSFFVLPYQEVDKLNISTSCTLPVITKSSAIPALIVLKEKDFENTISASNRTHLLDLSNCDESSFSKELKKYIAEGQKSEIDKRYKCKKRKRWYDVPIMQKGDACFFKRYHIMPRILINQAGVYTTDIVYNVRFHKQYDASSFVFCFYNSLTLALCEYNGRFYGGGVGELVPSEFKQLSIPYREVSEEYIIKLDQMFRDEVELNRIIDYVDHIVLADLSEDDLHILQKIRSRYLKRRLKKI